MRTTIYMPDELVGSVKEIAWRSRKSVSEYLMDLHREKLKGVNLKDAVLKNAQKVTQEIREDSPEEGVKGEAEEAVRIRDNGQEGVASREERLEKGKEIIFGYSKARQLGKKGGK